MHHYRWIILGSTILLRTHNSGDLLEGHVGSTWGTAQEQVPPTANFVWNETVAVTTKENGQTIVRNNQVERTNPLALDSTRVKVDLNLNHRQKGLLWYSTYAVDFAGDYSFHNDATIPRTIALRLSFPAQSAVYDGFTMTFNGQPVATSIDTSGAVSGLALRLGQAALLHVAYRSQGLDRWRYKLADGIAQVHVMHTNFKDIDFADDTFSPTAKKEPPKVGNSTGVIPIWFPDFRLEWKCRGNCSLRLLAGEISYFARCSSFFF